MLAGIFTICQGFISKDCYELPRRGGSWLVRSTPDRAVRIRALPGFLGKTLNSHGASLHQGVHVQLGIGG